MGYVRTLTCKSGTQTDVNFGDHATFLLNKEKKLISCPCCGSGDVAIALSAPRINSGVSRVAGADHLTMWGAKPVGTPAGDRSEFVGNELPETVRDMYAGHAPLRPIFGFATAAEVDEFVRDGVAIRAPRLDLQ